MNSLRMKLLFVFTAILLLNTGCASLFTSEKIQLAYTGAGPNPCIFGGVTDLADSHCAMMNFGVSGQLEMINRVVIDHLLPGDDCKVHAERASAAIAYLTNYKQKRIYSCPGKPSEPCHVSVLVSTPKGDYVLDNGAVFRDTEAANVGPLTTFARLTEGRYLIGDEPHLAQFVMMRDISAFQMSAQ